MEERAATIDLELYQERLLLVEEDYRRLCYEMKKKDRTRNTAFTKKKQHIKQQWEHISKLEKEIAELTLQVKLQESENLSSNAVQNLEDFMKLLPELVRMEKQMKEQTQMLENYNSDIAKLDAKLKQKQKDVFKAQRSKGRVLKNQKNLFFLENRLNDSLHKHNQILVSNNVLREDINSLLLTLNSFRRKYCGMKRLLAAGKKTLLEVVHSATASYQTGESVKYKLNLIKERSEIDQKKLDEKIKELKILVEQDKQLKEFLEFKLKDRSSSSDSEESARNGQIMEEKLQLIRETMTRIQFVSQCKDVNQICKAYIQGEEANLGLFQKVNELSLEIEKLHEVIRVESAHLDEVTQQFQDQNTKDSAAKHDIEHNTKNFCMEAQRLEDAVSAKAEEFETVKEVMHRIYMFLDHVSSQKVSFTIEERITDDNVLRYLEAIERRIMDLILCKEFTLNDDDKLELN